MQSNKLKPPERVLGLCDLNKSLFEKVISVFCLQLTDLKLTTVMPHVKAYMLKIENFKPVETLENNTFIVHLNPEKVAKWSDFEIVDRQFLESLNITEQNLIEREITLKYENFSANDVFKAVLPSNVEGMSSFTKVGHIVHINLREHLLPYKNLIGQVLLDKVKACRSVVNKTNMIDNTYRNFTMEVLCGETDMITKLKENNCTFEFDFSKVYWNSRLCTEHERIVKMLNAGDVLCDVFAGVGPFAIPTAKKKCLVFANDLNPESYKWLLHNAKINKISDESLQSCCKDGREFILHDVKKVLLQYLNKCDIHITMNLPSLAVEFLDCFVGLLKDETVDEIVRPVKVHVYCFAKGENYNDIAKTLVLQNIGLDITAQIVEIFRVRTVSNFKEMMRVTITLDRNVLLGSGTIKRKNECEDLAEAKLKKLNNGEAEKETQCV